MAVAGEDQEEDGAENFLETEILLGKLIRILPHSTPLELGLGEERVMTYQNLDMTCLVMKK